LTASMAIDRETQTPMESEPSWVLEARGVSVGYPTGNGLGVVVHDVDLSIARGESTALIGESGSGKTTLARALIGLLPSGARTLSGSVIFHRPSGVSLDLAHSPREEIRRLRWHEIAYVPQASASSFNPLLSVEDHFLETAAAHGMADRTAREKASELLRAVRLEPVRILRSFPHELSGGTAQRAFIALSLLFDPSLLVLDEPTTGLDMITQRSVVETLQNLRSRVSSSFLVVTHDLLLATELGERVFTRYAGRIVEHWQPALHATPNHPYTRALLDALPRTGEATEPVPIPGSPANPRSLPPGCPFHPRCSAVIGICAAGEPPLLRLTQDGAVACHLYDTGND